MAPLTVVSRQTMFVRQVVFVYSISFIAASPKPVDKIFFYCDIVVRTVSALSVLSNTND